MGVGFTQAVYTQAYTGRWGVILMNKEYVGAITDDVNK